MEQTTSSTTARAAGVALAFATLLAIGGCGGGSSSDGSSDTTATNQGDGTTAAVDLPSGTIEIGGGDDGASAQIGTDLPDDFPTEVYVPEDLLTTNVTRQERDDQVTFTLIGASTSGVDEMIADVQAAMGDATDRTDAGGITNLIYPGIDGETARYTIRDNADGAAVLTLAIYPDA